MIPWVLQATLEVLPWVLPLGAHGSSHWVNIRVRRRIGSGVVIRARTVEIAGGSPEQHCVQAPAPQVQTPADPPRGQGQGTGAAWGAPHQEEEEREEVPHIGGGPGGGVRVRVRVRGGPGGGAVG